MWEFDILSSPTTQGIPPCDPDSQDDELDNVLPPVDLHQNQKTDCNCFDLPINPFCPRDIHTHRMLANQETTINTSVVDSEGAVSVDEMGEIQQLTEILDVDVEYGEDVNQKEDEDSSDETSEQDVLYPEKFVVVGSWQEGRYQGAVAICMWRRSANKVFVFKVEHVPDNVQDSNALKFMVFHNENWHITGCCAVNKIPKLKHALRLNERHSISLDSLKRTYA